MITDSDSSSPQTSKLTGMGTFLTLTTPGNFGTIVYGAKSTKTVTLSNTGNSPVNISGIRTKGPFSQTNSCGSSIAAKSSCQITVQFAPNASGLLAGSVMVNANDPASPIVSYLRGTGQAIKLAPTHLDVRSSGGGHDQQSNDCKSQQSFDRLRLDDGPNHRRRRLRSEQQLPADSGSRRFLHGQRYLHSLTDRNAHGNR